VGSPGYQHGMRTTFLLLLALLVCAVPSRALAMGSDTPVRLATGAVDARAAHLSAGTPAYVPHFGVTFAAGFVAVPLGIALASAFGHLSNSLIGAVVPALLIMALVAPTLTTLAAWLYGNWNFMGTDQKPFGFWGPWTAAVVVNIISLIVGTLLAVSFAAPATVMMLSLVQSAITSGVVVGGMRMFRQDVSPITLRSFAPGVTDTQFIPFGQVAF
jgi:hypothetical protein